MAKEKKQSFSEKEATSSELFEFNLDRFLEELSALNDTLPIQMFLLDIKHKDLIKRLEKISKKTDGEDQNGKSVTKYKVLNEQLDDFSKIHKHLTRTDIAKKILPRNFIVSIVSQYDAFLGELVRTLYNINPNIIRASEKELNIEDLFNYETIEELKQHLVDKEVDSLLREEHYEQFKILEKRISVVTGKDFTLTSDLPILPYFIELTQRRNLFVHTNGMSTRQYLEFKNKWNFISECNGDINQELEADPDYCKKAYEILFEISVKLTHVLWRKFAPKEREEADQQLNHVIFELLVDGQYDLAIIICDFATNVLRKFSTEQLRKFIIINKAIAFKLLGKEAECKKIIQNEDWTIGNEFKLAKLILEDNYKGAKELMLKIGDKDELVNKKAYESWPLFKLFRKSQEFKEAYLELFKEEYSIEEVQNKPSEKDPQESETQDFEIEIEFEKDEE